MEFLEKRAFVGGLPKDITEEDLKARFVPFGSISEVDIIRHSDTGDCRGFAYITINLTTNNWKKCLSLYNGSRWKGMTLKVQDAKPSYKQRLQEELKGQNESDNMQSMLPKKRKYKPQHADDMNLVTDDNVEGRKGWKKSRCGHAVAVMRVRKENGMKVTIDPSQYDNNLIKFSENDQDITVKNDESYLNLFTQNWFNDVKGENGESGKNDENDANRETQHSNSTESVESLPPTIIDSLKKLKIQNEKSASKEEKSNQIRLEALEKRAQQKNDKMEKITRALRNDGELTKSNNHIFFPDNENSTTNALPEKISLIDSDSEETSMDIKINPTFEGPSGKELLNLQKKFRGDNRFKLNEDFINSDDEKNNVEQNTSADQNFESDDEISKSLEEEKSKRLGILNSLLGNDLEFKSPKKKPEWKEMVHFDPDAPEAKSFEIQRNDIKEESSEAPISMSNPLPIVSKEIKVEINADLKGIFAPGAPKYETFSLFSANEDNTDKTIDDHKVDETNEESLPSMHHKTTTSSQIKDNEIRSSGPLFFFHFENPDLSKRSHYRDLKIFMRNLPVEEIISHWQDTSRDMTKEYKRKHKSVSRKLLKMKNKNI